MWSEKFSRNYCYCSNCDYFCRFLFKTWPEVAQIVADCINLPLERFYRKTLTADKNLTVIREQVYSHPLFFCAFLPENVFTQRRKLCDHPNFTIEISTRQIVILNWLRRSSDPSTALQVCTKIWKLMSFGFMTFTDEWVDNLGKKEWDIIIQDEACFWMMTSEEMCITPVTVWIWSDVIFSERNKIIFFDTGN